jgi:RimJ/RimL family protein N-acetyltransferase
MTEFIVETFGIRVLYGRVMNGNKASIKVLEKNGYEFIKNLELKMTLMGMECLFIRKNAKI